MSYRHNGLGGVVINISSASARLGSPNEYVDYAASKGAVETFTTGFAKEVAREGIRVNCIRPGHIYTDMHASGEEPGRVDRIKDSIPMGRGGQPEEVARAILWLASTEASFITGTFLDVTGGNVLSICAQAFSRHGYPLLVITQASFANDGGIECCNENGVDSAFGKGAKVQLRRIRERVRR
eukprot:gene26575-29141_t